MKKFIIYSLIFINANFVFSQDFFNDRNVDLNRALDFYDRSIYDFSSIFSSNALRILLGNIDTLNTRWVELDIFSLAQLDNQHLRLLRNMIYAKHGYIFNSQELISYFTRFDWYNPKFNNVDELLTNVDRMHIQMIQAFENKNENLPNIVWNNSTGFWHDSPAVAADYSRRFIIHPNNRLEYYFSSMTNFPIGISLNGNYSISGNVLVYSVTEIYIKMNNSVLARYPWGYSWENNTGNKLTLDKPIVYRIHVSNIESYNWNNQTYETITIGGMRFFKISNNINAR